MSITIKPTNRGFVVTRIPCVVCGEPPFGDEYACGHKQDKPPVNRWQRLHDLDEEIIEAEGENLLLRAQQLKAERRKLRLQSKLAKQRLRAFLNSLFLKKLHRCNSLHHCELCDCDITIGQEYRGDSPGRRAHEYCRLAVAGELQK